MRLHCLTFFLLLPVLTPPAFSAAPAPAPAADPALTALARKAAGESYRAPDAKARAGFFAGLRAPALSTDARLHHAWTAVLLAETDDERRAILKLAAAIPDARARMLVAAFRDHAALRKDYAAADKALAQLLAPGAATTDAKGKRIPPRDIFGPNPFDTPALFDLWEPDPFSGRWAAAAPAGETKPAAATDATAATAAGAVAVEIVAYPQNNYKARLLRPGAPPLPLAGFAAADGSLLLLAPGIRGELRAGKLTLSGTAAGAPAPVGTAAPAPTGAAALALARSSLAKTFPEKRPAGAAVLLDET
ncbi:MAG: hypothetical protein LBC18_10245, partial [Opitutaceae bacterium]|nr:hypothetical protein [Opitutaceae bacterium]